MERNWVANYPDGVPAEINPDVYGSLQELFLKSCELYASHSAYTNLGTTLTYHEVLILSQQFAAYLQQSLGLQKGQTIALIMPNLLQFPVVMFGAFLAGLKVTNVNPLYTAREMAHQLHDAEADVVVVLENFASVLQEALPKTNVKHVIVTKLGDLFPAIKAGVVNFVLKYVKKMVPSWSIANAIAFKTTLQAGAETSVNIISLDASDIAFLQYTGGTTGVAKGAMLTHRNMLANMEQIYAWIAPWITVGEEVIITAIPLYHIFCLEVNCLTFFKMGGESVLITNPRDIPNFIKELKKYRFSAITGVNTLFNALLNNPKFKTVDFSMLKISLGGGMAVQRAVAEHWQQVTGKVLLEGYGLTEASPVVAACPVDISGYKGTIGLPLPSTDVKIIDDSGETLMSGETGELCVRGPQVMLGYWQRPDETQKVLTDDGWLLTGDIARIENDGFIKLVERKKDMIVVSGFNVYPNEIEDILAGHPGILEAAVIGVKHEKTGEAVKAVIVKKDKSLTADDIKQFCRQTLTAYKVPKIIEFRDDLPKSMVGKILRRVLRDETENVAST